MGLVGHGALKVEVDARGVAPKALETVEVAGLGVEDVDADRAVVDEHPVQALAALA